MLKINAENTSIGEILKSLKVYKEYQYFHERKAIKYNFELDSNGIPYYGLWANGVNAINNDPSKIIFVDILSEGAHMISALKKLDKTKKYIIFSNGWWDQDFYNLDIDYILVQWNVFLYDYITQISFSGFINYFVDKTYQFNIDRQHLFCSLIGVTKYERTILVDRLSQLNHSCIINYAGNSIKGDSKSLDISYNFNRYNSYKNIGENTEYTISRSIPIEIYNSSYFNLVVETNINLVNEFHFTEKTIKAFITGIPFVLVAGPGYLSRLKQMGFKTFENIWSEEYDNIIDFDQRITAIIELIDQLSALDWSKHQSELSNIAQHNRTHLAYYTNNIMKQQLDKLDEIINLLCEST